MRDRGLMATIVAILVLFCAFGARAELCAVDDVPAATLLLPYFEVDLDDRNGTNTLFSVNNAFPAAHLAQVTLWTDWAIPTLRFSIYLTGYDVQTMNIRDLFEGRLPRTAPDNLDPTDFISPQGQLSQDLAFASCSALSGDLDAMTVDQLRRAHRGQDAPALGGCLAADWGDGHVRGYITIDVITGCTMLDPADPGYAAVLSSANVLWGRVFQLDPGNNAASGESLVAIEACSPPSGDDHCPFIAGTPSFYGRYVGGSGADRREPLPSIFLTSFMQGGAFDAGTELTVWRDTLHPPTGNAGPRACNSIAPVWFPLFEDDAVAWDELENPTNLRRPTDIVDPPLPHQALFPLATQRLHLDEAAPGGVSPTPPFSFGWIFLNLRLTSQADEGLPEGLAQGWVTTTLTSAGRYNAAFDAAHLDNLCRPDNAPILLP